MNFILLAVSIVLVMQVKQCDSAHIAIVMMFGRSHFAEYTKLTEELKLRGHKVVMYLGEGETYAAGKPNTILFKYTDEMKRAWSVFSKGYARLSSKDFDIWNELYAPLFKTHTQYCDSLISDARAFRELKTADLIIGDAPYPCGNLIADWLDRPLIYFATTNFLQSHLFYRENPLAYVPQSLSGLSSSMTFWERIKNLKHYLVNKYMVEKMMLPAYQIVKDKYKIKPSKTLKESLFNAELIIYPADFILEHAQPIFPFFREVGYFLPGPPQPLPQELDEFMQGSGDDGVVVLAFGSNVGGVSKPVIEKLSYAFSKLPSRVLWKVYSESYPKTVSPNVKLVEWLPQNDVLGHNNTRLFITHAGSNSMAEAAYHGIPVVVNPFFGDQHGNSLLLKEAGMGEIIDLVEITGDELVSVIRKVLDGKSYRQNAARVSRAMRSRARTPVQEAADLVEYVQSVGHMTHLKPRSLFMPFYQVYMLDVIAVLFSVLVAVLALFVILIRFLIQICSSKKTKTA